MSIRATRKNGSSSIFRWQQKVQLRAQIRTTLLASQTSQPPVPEFAKAFGVPVQQSLFIDRHSTAFMAAQQPELLGCEVALDVDDEISRIRSEYVDPSVPSSRNNAGTFQVNDPPSRVRFLEESLRNQMAELKTDPTLRDLQEYLAAVCIERNWTKDSPSEKFVLLVEEIGELAKALRQHAGLYAEQAKASTMSMEEEFADVLSYLLDLANCYKVDLERAFRAKEARNETRKWQ